MSGLPAKSNESKDVRYVKVHSRSSAAPANFITAGDRIRAESATHLLKKQDSFPKSSDALGNQNENQRSKIIGRVSETLLSKNSSNSFEKKSLDELKKEKPESPYFPSSSKIPAHLPPLPTSGSPLKKITTIPDENVEVSKESVQTVPLLSNKSPILTKKIVESGDILRKKINYSNSGSISYKDLNIAKEDRSKVSKPFLLNSNSNPTSMDRREEFSITFNSSIQSDTNTENKVTLKEIIQEARKSDNVDLKSVILDYVHQRWELKIKSDPKWGPRMASFQVLLAVSSVSKNVNILHCSDLLNYDSLEKTAFTTIQLMLCLRISTNQYSNENMYLFIISSFTLLPITYFLVYGFRDRAFRLLLQSDEIKNLVQANDGLSKELKDLILLEKDALREEEEKVKKIDFNSPLSKSILKLQEIRSRNHDSEIAYQITEIIKILTSNDLFKVDLEDKAVDDQVHGWLKTMLNFESSKQENLKRNTPSPKFGILIDNSSNVFKDNDATNYIRNNTDSIDFDTIKLTLISSGHPVVYIGFQLFQKYNLISTLKIETDLLKDFFLEVESQYDPTVPYHNCAHAADVCQFMNLLIQNSDIDFPYEDITSMLIAALWHDMKHPGFNNNFLIQTSHDLAIQYNDISVLENMHSFLGFSILQNQKYNILKNLSKETNKSIRDQIISMVLATDMSFHFELIGKFKNKIASETSFDIGKLSDKKLLMEMMMKAADISNASRPFEVAMGWTFQIMEEFFRQGEEENARNLPISTFMNRNGTDISKSQVSFIDFVVTPMFDAISPIYSNSLKPAYENLKRNRTLWSEARNLPPNNLLPLSLTKYTFDSKFRKKSYVVTKAERDVVTDEDQ